MYYKEVREPTEAEWKLSELAVGIAAIAIERELNEAYVRHIAHHDALTGLPNRVLLEDRLQQAIAQAHRHDRMVAVLFLDLDHFKHINDSLGHHVGDALLQQVARRMESCLREGDSVARLGGDEFIISLCDISRNQDAAGVAFKLQQALSDPFLVEGRTLQVGSSIGISLYPIDGTDVKTLMRAADAAMYDAKAKGRANYQFFTPELNIVAHRRLLEATQLRQALAREEFVLHYQPQLHVGSGAIVGAEALLRWQHPEHGLLPPARFVGALEDLGLMSDVGNWVLRTACRQCVEWQRAGLPPIRMAVNLSARQFSSGDIVRSVAEVLLETGLDPQWLELELTESLILDNSERVITAMNDLKKMGVRLSLDDFGTGYSSLSYLRRFPVDRLKIDRSFIRDITSDAGCADIVRSILALSQKLGIAVIAEGVENEAQLGYLRRQGCAEVQGFLYSRPVPAADMTELLRADRRLPVPDASSALRTMLVVDGDEHAAAVLQQVLRAEGMRVIAASTAEQALELLAMHYVQVIVADLHLPDGSGIEFLSLAKKLYPNAIRVLATETTEVASVVNAINRGAIYKLLVKPWDNQALVENIRDAFSLYSALQESSARRESPAH
jgi:diguanylate cyclase (GGDEF)-like protein